MGARLAVLVVGFAVALTGCGSGGVPSANTYTAPDGTTLSLSTCGENGGSSPLTDIEACERIVYRHSHDDLLHAPGLLTALTAATDAAGRRAPVRLGGQAFHLAVPANDLPRCPAIGATRCTVVLALTGAQTNLNATAGGAAYCSQNPGCRPETSSAQVAALRIYAVVLKRSARSSCLTASLTPQSGWYAPSGGRDLATAATRPALGPVRFVMRDPAEPGSGAEPCA